MYIIGPLEDQTAALSWSHISDRFFGSSLISNSQIYQVIFRDLLAPWTTNQPILNLFISTLLTLLGKNGYNIILLLTFFLNFIFSFIYFKKYKFGFYYSLLYILSSYVWIHLTHLALLQIWLFPLFLIMLEKFRLGQINIVKMSLFITLSILISNYIGFFILIIFSFDLVSERLDKKHVKKFIQVVILSMVLTIIFVSPFIKQNYFNVNKDKLVHQRTSNQIEDFLIFSSKPWHFILPSVKNPLYGKEISSLRIYLEKIRFIIIFDQYFDREHNASFFGFAFLIAFVSLLVNFVYKYRSTKILNKYLLVSILIFLFIMPPYILIRGIKFYSPGYLMYLLFPMFRSISRLSIVLLLYLLTIFAIIIDYRFKQFDDKTKKVVKILIPILFLITVIEVFVPQNIKKTDTPAQIYTYINQYTKRNTKIAVYPYSKTNEAVYWLSVHKSELINPRGYEYSNFNSEKFTKNMPTESGVNGLKETGVKYLIVFTNIDISLINFFANSDKLLLEKKFDDSYLYSIR